MKVQLARKSNSHSEYNKYIVTTKKGIEYPVYARNIQNARFRALIGVLTNYFTPTTAALILISYLLLAAVLFSGNIFTLFGAISLPVLLIFTLTKFL